MNQRDLLACTLMAGAASLALASPAAAQTRSFHVPPGDLAVALNTYARQSGDQLIYSTEQLRGAKTAGVSGELAPADALQHILRGTRFTIQRERTGAVVVDRNTVRGPAPTPARGLTKASARDGERFALLAQPDDGLQRGASAAAGEADEANPASAPSELEELVVTARKREESLQEAPVSVAAVTGENVERSGAVTMDNLSVPGLTFATSGGTRPYLAIRGSGNRSGGGDSPVGVFMDGVYIPRNAQLAHGPIDVQRIEVIKGPQGTIYGRNTIAGAINIITNDPTPQFEAHVQAGVGGSINEDRLYNAEMVVSGPLIQDELMVRLVVAHDQRRGFQLDDTTGHRANGYNTTVLRGKLLWSPNDNFDAKLTVDFVKDNRPRGAYLYFGPGRVMSTNPSFPVSRLHFGSIWDIRSEYQTFERSQQARGILDMNWTTPVGTVTSVTSIGKSKVDFLYNQDDTQFDINTTFSGERSDDFSQELRLTGDAGPWDWLLGAYYFRERTNSYILTRFGVDSLNPGRQQNGFTDLHVDAYAAFGQLSYDITDALTVTGGLRYSLDKKVSPFLRTVNGVLNANQRRKDDWDSVDGGLTVRYRYSPDGMVYASVNTGFKSGGFVDPRSLIDASLSYGPEKVTAYEVGAKTEFFDRRLRVNVAAFYNMYRDLQVTSARPDPLLLGATIFVTQNAAEANIPGAEVEITAKLSENFTLQAAYSYIEAKIDKFNYVPGPASVDINGAPIPRTPKNAVVVGLFYEKQVGPGDLFMGVTYDWKDKFVNELETRLDPTGRVANAPLPARGLVNLQASYEWDDWTVSGYVRNLFNKAYTVVALQSGNTNFPYANPGEPRTVGVALRRDF